MTYRGTSLALLMSVLSPITHGCLVTESIDFPEEENEPPIILPRPGSIAPPGAIIRAVPGDELEFEVLVRDVNVSQTLEWSVLRNYDPALFPTVRSFGGSTLEPDGERERDLDFNVQSGGLGSPGTCVRLDLFVSGKFQPLSPPIPEIDGDLSRARWWIELVDDLENPSSPVPLGDCPE